MPRLALAPIATFLAACLLAWVVLRGGPEEPAGYSFEVVHAKDSADLNPIARLSPRRSPRERAMPRAT